MASVTLLTTMLDFSDTGEIGVYVDEAYVAQREQRFAQRRRHARQGARARVLRACARTTSIWHYVVNNYLKGDTPAAFDLLYWNSDSTNLPGPMYAYYLRNMYLDNNLRDARQRSRCAACRSTWRSVDVPAYILATREDHIVPWKTAYQSTRLLGGDIRIRARGAAATSPA